MPANHRRIPLAILLTLVSTGVLAFVLARPKDPLAATEAPQAAAQRSSAIQAQRANAFRNLSRQPEAFNLAKRLGKRFSPNQRGKSVLAGELTVGTEKRSLHIIRSQKDDGEQVEIDIAGSPGPLVWETEQGGMAKGKQGSNELDLLERLALDSPDQFVLAQLRGASYFTIARNVRPEEAGENYDGPLWNIVRVDDSQRDEQKRPQSPWRLYYINVKTGLIDRIVSEINGERVEATMAGWTEVKGERVPSEVVWTRGGNTIMHFRLTKFAHTQQ